MKSKEKINLVWLKRDLRLNDHGPISYAAKSHFPTLVFYVCENQYWKTNKASPDQLEYVEEALLDLTHKFKKTSGGKLQIFHTPTAVETFKVLLETYDIQEIYSHQETGNLWTFQRDQTITKLLKTAGIPFQEFLQNGVTRGHSKRFERLADSETWWDWLKSPLNEYPTSWKNPKTAPPERLTQWGKYPSSNNSLRQKGGESSAHSLLNSFINERAFRGKGYRKELGSPLNSDSICSRLSTHLTWGSLSTKMAAHYVIRAITQEKNTFRKQQYQSFLTRLHWRDHFIQKFESISWMEFQYINPAMEGIRTENKESLERFLAGETGYPFVDACMRSLTQSLWLNFRARALLISFASYALNLDWRTFGPFLAQRFLDYEPGIHYSQLQMQSGTTLSAPPRIYNPIKQSLEKDPEGKFIKKWIPELKNFSPNKIHYPHNWETSIKGYPKPILPMQNLLTIMRNNAPRKKEKENNQLEFSIN